MKETYALHCNNITLVDDVAIRHTEENDIPMVIEIFAKARKFMSETGNPHQWAESYPSEELLKKDIASGDSYVCMRNERIVATFVLRGGTDPTYNVIYGGAWQNEEPYATIHRIASNGEAKGILHIAMRFAQTSYNNIRIDTHRDNTVMQKAIAKEGFKYCGIIHCWNGEERLAFQFTKNGVGQVR